MGELSRNPEGEYTKALEERRLLTELMHLYNHMHPDESVPVEILRDVHINRSTHVREIAMPSAVTTTIHAVEHVSRPEGRQDRIFKWLGKTAIQVAESGYIYHFSEAAYKRVDVEVAEARYSQETLRPGQALAFISPKMTDSDASKDVAEKEHLYEDDSIRVSKAVTDSHGNLVARKMESLLVTDVPFESWVSMLEDEKNVFNQSFKLKNKTSAISVMELFRDFDVPEEILPEGPVTLVAAVLPYISNPKQRLSVEKQLAKFRSDQDFYRCQAEQKAADWVEFDLEMARSLYRGKATFAVEQFIAGLQHQWGDDDLQVILEHDTGGTYTMTPRLAAVLANAQQNIIGGIASIATSNNKVLEQMDTAIAEKLRQEVRYVEAARSVMPPGELHLLQAQLYRSVAYQNLEVKGGCAGGAKGNFRDGNPTGDGHGENDINDIFLDNGSSKNNISENSANWTWRKGACRVGACKSPKPTEVGPCNVCRNCQHLFDKGIDPTKSVPAHKPKKDRVTTDWLNKLLQTNTETIATNGGRAEVAGMVYEAFRERGGNILRQRAAKTQTKSFE